MLEERMENIAEETEETMEEEVFECERCGHRSTDRDEFVELQDGLYCEECVGSCEECGVVMSNDDICWVASRRRWDSDMDVCVCQECRDNVYTYCDSCNEYFPGNRILFEDSQISICDNCSENYTRCEGCGAIIHHDDANYYEDEGEYYCNCCYKPSHLRNYGSKPYYTTNVAEGEDRDAITRFYGIEQETDNGDDRRNYSNDLYELSNDEQLFIQKTDGSLDEGVEIVSMPCSFRFFMEEYPLQKIWDIARDYGFKAHDTKTCGLHVHVSRAGLGDNPDERDLTIAKLIYLFDEYWDNIVKFSRRDYNGLSWAKKPDAEIHKGDKPDDAIKKANGSYDRYRAINLNNTRTIEFRVFRGSLNADTVKATLQFCETLINFSMAHTIDQVYYATWAEIVESDFKELNEYLAKRGISGKEVE